jgi:hypothetical protein
MGQMTGKTTHNCGKNRYLLMQRKNKLKALYRAQFLKRVGEKSQIHLSTQIVEPVYPNN